MTWLAADTLPASLLPGLPAEEEPLPQSPPVPPMLAGPLFDADDSDADWMTTLSPAERDMAQRSGFFPMQQWERWRQRMTRGSDGIL